MKQKQSTGYQARQSDSPPNSYSRQLDKIVSEDEPAYGYSDTPPLMGYENPETLKNIQLQKLKKI